MSQTMTTTNNSALELPKDALAEIHLRLPVRSLLRFKTVSKQFYQLISDPWFIPSYKHRMNSLKANTRSLIVQSYSPSRLCLLTCITGETDTLNTVPYYFDLDLKKMCLISSCDGLLSYIKDETTEFVVGDPMRNCWLTVDPGLQISKPVLLVFYFHASTREHKMLWQSDGPNRTCRYDIFTLGSNSWQQIGDSIYKPFPQSVFSRNPPLLHGRLHWIGPKLQKNGRLSINKWTTINTFHIDSFDFSQISHPSCIRFQLKSSVVLDIQQKLCVCKFIEDKKKVKYWVLEDYGKMIWRKKRAYMEEVKGVERNLVPLVCLSSCAVFVQLHKVRLVGRRLEHEKPVFYYWDFKEFVPKEIRGDFSMFFYKETLAKFMPPVLI